MTQMDPVADMLTIIRNALQIKRRDVSFPKSRVKADIVKILKKEGYIKSYEFDEGDGKGNIKLELKYYKDKPVIEGLKRISKPGRRVYVKKDEIPYILNGLGTCIVSTSKGVLPGYKARSMGIGGELICSVW